MQKINMLQRMKISQYKKSNFVWRYVDRKLLICNENIYVFYKT